MKFYLIILLILIAIIVGLIVWIFYLVKLFRKGRKKSFAIQVSILALFLIFVTWKFQIFPRSKNFYIKERTEQLTGKSFWSWKEFSYEEISVRGEGYTLDIYKFNDEMANYFSNPDSAFFQKYPLDEETDIKWQQTPVSEIEKEILEFVTPIYVGWEGEIVEKQDFIKNIANKNGSYYSYRHGGSTNFYLISPKDKLIIMINHNM
ncbi:MAG: hypothetical protein K8R54_03475 [Bacteroidales bacterium]|nr:hypothetical protein [Bacteroidales bacterium]